MSKATPGKVVVSCQTARRHGAHPEKKEIMSRRFTRRKEWFERLDVGTWEGVGRHIEPCRESRPATCCAFTVLSTT